MQINVKYLDNLKLSASFENYTIISDQPMRYKGDGTAPGPFDYFLASSALCAAYFVKVYCNARGIPTDEINVVQNNIINPENRYDQTINLEITLPPDITDKDRDGILKSMERCTVKKVINQGPKFNIVARSSLENNNELDYETYSLNDFKTKIPGKDLTLEETITRMRKMVSDIGIKLEISSWRNPIPHVWSVHIRDAEAPMCYTNGKGATQKAALCSALGEYLERLSTNYFYNDYYLGPKIANDSFVHYPNEQWFEIPNDDLIPNDLMDDYLLKIYNPVGELFASHLIDSNSGNTTRGICAIPFKRLSDDYSVYIPVNLISNLYASNGMSAGNTPHEAYVQALSEIFERSVKHQIIKEEIALPDIPEDILKKYPNIFQGISELREKGYPLLVKDASLGGRFPVVSITLMNPETGGIFASFGAHPKFQVALERTLTELLQGRSFPGLDKELQAPTFNSQAVNDPNNIIDHFIDSTGIVSWKFFSQKSPYQFTPWNFHGDSTQEFNYLVNILKNLKKDIYIADYPELGSHACRILVPAFSEIYEIDDLVWDNNNKAVNFREPILNIHRLKASELKNLIKNLDEIGADDYMMVGEFIGVLFDETSAWGRLTIGELKGLIWLSLGAFENAKHFVTDFLHFNDNTHERRRFYQLLEILLDIEIQKLDFKDYEQSLTLMYGKEFLDLVRNCVLGKNRFYGLPETDSNFLNLDKHLALLDNFRKIQNMRRNFTPAP